VLSVGLAVGHSIITQSNVLAYVHHYVPVRELLLDYLVSDGHRLVLLALAVRPRLASFSHILV